MAVTASGPAPYAPASAVLGVVERVRSRGLPDPITGEVLARAGISGSLIPRTLQALQTLDLIEEGGAHTSTLNDLRLAPEAEYKHRLGEWITKAYADIFSFVDPKKDGETAIRDAFRSYRPIGQQDRMVTLFTGLCGAAGLMPEKAKQPARSTEPGASRQRAPARVRAGTGATTIGRRRSRQSSPHFSTDSMPPPLAGLLATLPSADTGWSKTRRDNFMSAFGSVLDFCIPIVEDEAADKTEDGGA